MSMACLWTGQTSCHDADGRIIPCAGSGQDAEFRAGIPWPTPRFEARDEIVLDRLTGLMWTRNANLAEYPMTWPETLDFVAGMNRERILGFSDWRLPNTPLLRTENVLILNRDDGSRFFAPSLAYSLATNWDWEVGIQFFGGGADSEYGQFHDVYHTHVQWFF